MTKEPLKIKVIIGSTRHPRFSEKPAKYIYEELQKVKGVNVELLDLRDYPMPFFDAPVSPMRSGGAYTDPGVIDWAAKIEDGDAFVVVTPEYNYGYPAVLKNAFDSIYPEWNHKAIGFVSYGTHGGARVIQQLLQVAIALRLVPIHKSVSISSDVYFKAMSEDTSSNHKTFDQLRNDPRGDAIEVFFSELIHMGMTLKSAKGSF